MEIDLGIVLCPSCRGRRTCYMCWKTYGKMERTAAILWCELYQKTDDTTDEQKAEVAAYAISTYSVDILHRPRTDLDDQLDAIGIP